MTRLMLAIPVLIIIFAALVAGMLFLTRRQNSVKVMLLGIALMLFGGIFAVDASAEFYGGEYIFVLFGLIITLVGAFKNDK